MPEALSVNRIFIQHRLQFVVVVVFFLYFLFNLPILPLFCLDRR